MNERLKALFEVRDYVLQQSRWADAGQSALTPKFYEGEKVAFGLVLDRINDLIKQQLDGEGLES